MKVKNEWALAYDWNETNLREFTSFQSQISKQLGFSEAFIRLLWQRGLEDISTVERYLEKDKDIILNYYEKLFDARGAAALLLLSLKQGRKIFIYGDYDVDGITSTSLLWRFLYREMKADVTPFIPHRSREGYGLNERAIMAMLETQFGEDPKREVLLITVDCGIKDNELITSLKANYPKLKVMVTDHHQLPVDNDSTKAEDLVPSADAVIHPLHPQSKVDPHEICACAVVWAMITAARKELGLKPNLEGLELVALATVCDVMPLTGLNRQIVALGLEQLKSTNIPGLKALMAVAGVKGKLQAYHLGFHLGPRLNAAGRIGEPLLAVRLLSTDNETTAYRLAGELDALNQQRQGFTEAALELVGKQIQITGDTRLLVVSDPDWEEGIIGLIAGKLHEKYGVPAIAMTKKESGEWVGSARSNKHIDITGLLGQHQHHLSRFGGHVQAAGFSLPEENLSAFKREIIATAEKQIGAEHIVQTVKYDLPLLPKDISLKFIKEIELLEPFGNLNLPPIFFLSKVSAQDYREFGKNKEHLSLNYIDPETGKLEVVWFHHAMPRELFSGYHDFIGSLGYNEWNGIITPQFKVKHQRVWQDSN